MATELGAGRARRSRPGPAAIGELIGLVYESLDEPERWTAFLDRLTDASRGASMVFFRQDVDRPGATVPMFARAEWVARGASRGVRGAGGSLAISRPSRQRPLSVLVSPLHADHYRLGASIAVAAVFVGDPEERSEPDADVIRRLYGLTRAETSLVLALLSGLSLGDAAEALAITGNTARTHLKRVFAKTGVSRQSELIRVLVTGPAQVAPT